MIKTAVLLTTLLAGAPLGAMEAVWQIPTAGAGASIPAGDTLPEPDPPALEPASGEESPPSVALIRVEGPISPTTSNYIGRALSLAEERQSPLLVIELDTPGGLLDSTQDIVRMLFDARVPVVVYVSPDGARAASAGTFITMAAHVAAMSRSTTIGAASPVTMSPGAQADTVMQQKIFSATESLVRSIAERRERNMDWAISAVREGASATETEALELGVIDLVATDRQDLLRQLDGWDVDGDTLRVEGASFDEIPLNLAERLLGLLMRPEVMLMLMLVAMYGIIGEMTNPGAIFPGVAGVIALVLLLFASAAMPINTAGYILLALAIGLFVAEAFTPTFGILLGTGVVAFFLGALMLFQDFPEPMALPWTWLIPATLLTAGLFVWVATYGLKAQFSKPRSGREALVGATAEVVDRVDASGGRVFVAGEYWHAVSDQELHEGETCEIVEVEGLKLKVRPASPLARSIGHP